VYSQVGEFVLSDVDEVEAPGEEIREFFSMNFYLDKQYQGFLNH